MVGSRSADVAASTVVGVSAQDGKLAHGPALAAPPSYFASRPFQLPHCSLPWKLLDDSRVVQVDSNATEGCPLGFCTPVGVLLTTVLRIVLFNCGRSEPEIAQQCIQGMQVDLPGMAGPGMDVEHGLIRFSPRLLAFSMNCVAWDTFGAVAWFAFSMHCVVWDFCGAIDYS